METVAGAGRMLHVPEDTPEQASIQSMMQCCRPTSNRFYFVSIIARNRAKSGAESCGPGEASG